MKLTIRAATPAEQLYAYAQSTQLNCQCGSPGYLWGELDSSNSIILNSWKTFVQPYSTPEFKAEFNTVLDMLRFDERYDCPLKDYKSLSKYCVTHPDGRIGDSQEYAFRADTKDYSYLIRYLPSDTSAHVCIYPYRKEQLDRHMKQAARGIRFITPDYKEKFKVPNGENVRIFTGDGETRDYVVQYIDDYHVELINENSINLYHICELAERLEQSGSKVIPIRSTLPEQCYSMLLNTGEIVILKRGETGYYPTDIPSTDKTSAKELVELYNSRLGVTKAQFEAMKAGSMFGWEVPAADPKNYDEKGQPIKPTQKNRGDSR